MDPRLDDERITTMGMLVEVMSALNVVLEAELAEQTRLPTAWFGLLLRLGRTPERRLRMSDLARSMALSPSGLTRLVDRVERAGLVAREACPTDRRGWFAVLTPEGEARLLEALPVHLDGLQRHLIAALSPGESKTLTDLLRRVRDHLHATARGPTPVL